MFSKLIYLYQQIWCKCFLSTQFSIHAYICTNFIRGRCGGAETCSPAIVKKMPKSDIFLIFLLLLIRSCFKSSAPIWRCFQQGHWITSRPINIINPRHIKSNIKSSSAFKLIFDYFTVQRRKVQEDNFNSGNQQMVYDEVNDTGSREGKRMYIFILCIATDVANSGWVSQILWMLSCFLYCFFVRFLLWMKIKG